jgi:hypothetical protein
MSALCQLKLPPELQALIHSFAYYSKEEALQRQYKGHVVSQLKRCKRVWGKVPEIDPYFEIFYFKTEKYNYYLYSNLIYIEYYYSTLSAVFCKECHNYVSSTNEVPSCIECNCLPGILGVD